MNKIWLIIKREYLNRVRRRSFILGTILAPLGLFLYILAVTLIMSYSSDDTLSVYLVDEAGLISDLQASDNIIFNPSDASVDSLRTIVSSSAQEGILYLPSPEVKNRTYRAYYYADEAMDLTQTLRVQKILSEQIENYKQDALSIDAELLELLDTDITIDPEPIIEGDKDRSSMTAGIASGIGIIIGMILFFMTFMYGMMVMRGVMEEKTSRIIELMVSSVRPIDLMMGKILGVGLVALTQLGIWMISIPVIYGLASLLLGRSVLPGSQMQPAMDETAGGEIPIELTEVLSVVGDMNWWFIVPMMVIYLIGGYLLYSAIYAALGSAIGEDLGEAQSLTMPVSIPIVIGFYIMFMAAQAPNSSLAIIGSIFPLTSPLVMPARLAFAIPYWQIILSLVLLGLTIWGAVWLSARIYRTGILMYGKKASFRELWKWIRL